ncbi:hypothetical protein [Vibrio metschnikovii]|uniref:hypothetical protein n=1 Tax=Vibrio metschnikovii TaxID=28172 RepID=UPI001C30605E|nr:hypothetical protein [Vibrio metschnikovii]
MSVSDWVVIILISMSTWPFLKNGPFVLKALICSAFIIPLATLEGFQECIEKDQAAKKSNKN